MNKYELTNETIKFDGRTLYRIKALIDFDNVKAGDLGGFIEKESNLSQNNNCWVYDNAKVFGNAICSKTPIYLGGLEYHITITDDHIQIGCKQFELKQALELNRRWKHTKETYEEAQEIDYMRKIIVEAIKLRLEESEK